MTNAVNLASAAGTGFAFRNRIINGDMRINQRGGTITSPSGSVAYGIDRWRIVRFNDTTGTFTLQQSNTAPSDQINSALITVTAAQSSVPATGLYRFEQAIEGVNINDLGWGTASAKAVTISFNVRSSVTGTYGGRVTNGSENRSYVFQFTINSANTFETKTITIPGDTTGTWATDNSIGLWLVFDLGSGSSYEGTANAWSASNVCRAAGNARLISTNAATFYVTSVQLEVGSVATPFERRPYGLEYELCRRYRRKVGIGFDYDGNIWYGGSFSIDMRATPSLVSTVWSSVISNVATGGSSVNGVLILAADANSQDNLGFQVTRNATGRAYGWGYCILDAEL